MVPKPFIGLLIYAMVFCVFCQDFNFQRVIQCQNNDFQVVEEDAFENEQNANSLGAIISEESLVAEQQNQIKRTVRCRKWVQSYKMVKKANLRKEGRIQPQIISQQTRKTLNEISKRGLFTPDQPQQPKNTDSTPELKRTSSVSSTSASEQQQQVDQLMSIYYHYTMMNDIVIYGSQYSSLVAA